LFAQALTIAPHLFSGGLFGMVYEHLSRCFIPKYPSSWFLELFQDAVIITHGDIPRLMALMLGLIDCWQWQKTLVVFVLLSWMKCFFIYELLHYFITLAAILEASIPPPIWSFDPWRL